MIKITKRFRVTGRVQGVGFRAATQQQAQTLGLKGWVRNCADGAVELMAEGAADELACLEDWLHQGPPAARVDGVESRVVDQVRNEGLDWPFGVRR